MPSSLHPKIYRNLPELCYASMKYPANYSLNQNIKRITKAVNIIDFNKFYPFILQKMKQILIKDYAAKLGAEMHNQLDAFVND